MKKKWFLWFLCWFTSIAPVFWLYKQWRNAGIKSRQHALKNVYEFFLSMTEEPIFACGCVFSKILHVCLDRDASTSQKLGLAPGLANTQPTDCAKFANAPLPGQTRRANAPQLPGRGKGHGYTWNWLMHKTLFISRWCSLHFQLLLEFTHSTLTESGMVAASNLI